MDLLLAIAVMVLVVGTLGGWAVRAERRRRRGDEAALRRKEEVV